MTVRVDGRTLVIQRNTSAWGGFPGQDRGPVTIAVATPGLVAASLAGSGRLDVDAMRGARIDLAVTGSGRLALGRIETDRLGALLTGSGGLAIAGRAATAQLDAERIGPDRRGEASRRATRALQRPDRATWRWRCGAP